MISGIFLSMHYTPNVDLAFSSIEYIMRDVNNGWLFDIFMLMVHLCFLL
jgi:ubiquinol-cytochrome c reductase cytochrome b subunit